MTSKTIHSQPDLFPSLDAQQREPKEEATSRKGAQQDAARAERKAQRAAAAAQDEGRNRNRGLKRWLSDLDVAEWFGVSRPTVWRWCDRVTGFPQPRKVSPGTTRWLRSEVEAFEDRISAASRGQERPVARAKARGTR